MLHEGKQNGGPNILGEKGEGTIKNFKRNWFEQRDPILEQQSISSSNPYGRQYCCQLQHAKLLIRDCTLFDCMVSARGEVMCKFDNAKLIAFVQ